MFAPASATAIALLVEVSRWEPCCTLTVATTAALASAVPAIIAKSATGNAMPCSLRASSQRRRRIGAGICIVGLIGCGWALLESWNTRRPCPRTLVLVASGAGELLDAARALAARGQHQLEVVRAGGVIE